MGDYYSNEFISDFDKETVALVWIAAEARKE